MHVMERLSYPVIAPLWYILPVEKFPELALVILIGIVFMISHYILTVTNIMQVYTNPMIALFMVAIGSGCLEMINLTLATKKGMEQMGLTSILSGLVLTMTGIIPIACLIQMHRTGSSEIQILEVIHTRDQFLVMPIIISVIVMLIYTLQ